MSSTVTKHVVLSTSFCATPEITLPTQAVGDERYLVGRSLVHTYLYAPKAQLLRDSDNGRSIEGVRVQDDYRLALR